MVAVAKKRTPDSKHLDTAPHLGQGSRWSNGRFGGSSRGILQSRLPQRTGLNRIVMFLLGRLPDPSIPPAGESRQRNPATLVVSPEILVDDGIGYVIMPRQGCAG